jgi:hypothetical protein
MAMCVFAYLRIWAPTKDHKAGLKIQKTLSEKTILCVLLRICVFVFKAKKPQPKHWKTWEYFLVCMIVVVGDCQNWCKI